MLQDRVSVSSNTLVSRSVNVLIITEDRTFQMLIGFFFFYYLMTIETTHVKQIAKNINVRRVELANNSNLRLSSFVFSAYLDCWPNAVDLSNFQRITRCR